MIRTRFFDIKTEGDCHIVDITKSVSEALDDVALDEGLATVFVSGSTASITTLEFEPGLVKDLRGCFERLIPERMRYHHEDTWHDGNGHSHVRSALLKTSFSVPFINGKLILGAWQQIVLVDFDNRPRTRHIVIQLMGERSKKQEKVKT